jgi:hypothetical protein
MGLDHDVGRTPYHQEMLYIVTTDQNEPAAPVNRCRIDDRKPRLAPAGSGIGQPLAAEPAHEPQGQRQEAEHHNKGEQHLESILSLAEQGVEHHSSLCPQGMAPRSELPEWLTPRHYSPIPILTKN